MRAMVVVLDALHERGELFPRQLLTDRIRAYANSWAATDQDGKFVPMLVKWLEDGRYDQDDRDWENPKALAARDRKVREHIAFWKRAPHHESIGPWMARMTAAERERNRQDWIRLAGIEGPFADPTSKLRLA